MIYALISIFKTLQNFKKKSTLKILIKIMKSLDLNHFENIQMITQGRCFKNGTFVKYSKKDIFHEKDLGSLSIDLFLF